MLIGFGVLTMWAIKTWRKYLCHRVWCVCLLVDRRWQHLVRRTAVRDQPLILLATACLSSPDHVPRISHSPILTRRTMRHQASNIPHQPFLHATRPPPPPTSLLNLEMWELCPPCIKMCLWWWYTCEEIVTSDWLMFGVVLFWKC